MKLRYAFFLCSLILVSTAKALTELSFAIKQDAYQKIFFNEKKDFTSKSASTLTPKDAAQNITALIQFIKPSRFKTGFSIENFIKNVNSVTTLKQANNFIKTLEQGLTTSAFNPMWKMQRNNWLRELK